MCERGGEAGRDASGMGVPTWADTWRRARVARLAAKHSFFFSFLQNEVTTTDRIWTKMEFQHSMYLRSRVPALATLTPLSSASAPASGNPDRRVCVCVCVEPPGISSTASRWPSGNPDRRVGLCISCLSPPPLDGHQEIFLLLLLLLLLLSP